MRRFPPRFRAFSWHLLASTVVAGLVLWVVFSLWYPTPLHVATGVGAVFVRLLLVDVILGPLLTLLVYRQGKRSLKFDMACIVVLQVAALGYGLLAVAQGRPVWLVFNVDRFDVVQAKDVDIRPDDKVPANFAALSWRGPRWVLAQPPQGQLQQALLFESALGGSDLPQRPVFYQSLDLKRVESVSRPLQELGQYNAPHDIERALAPSPQARAWLPLMAAQPMVVLINPEADQPLIVVDLRPWP